MREAIFHCDDSLCKHILLIVNSKQQQQQKKMAERNLKWFIFVERAVVVPLIYDCVCTFSCSKLFKGENCLFFNYFASKCLLLELEIMSCMLLNMLIKHEKLLSCGNVRGKVKRTKERPANLRLQIVRLSVRR